MASNAVLDLIINLAGDASEKVSGIADQIGGLGPLAAGAGLAIGGALLAGLGQGFALATDAKQGVSDLQAQLGLTAEEAEGLGQIGEEVFAGNWYGSISEATAAVGVMEQALGRVAIVSDEELKKSAESAAALKDVFGVEVPESANAAAVLMDKFGLSSQEAFDFIASGFQKGMNASGDFLESVTEYGVQFGDSGASADQFFSVLETGLQGGALGTDKIADAFKESRIRIMEMSDDVLSGFEAIGRSAFKNATGISDSFGKPGETLDWLKGKAAELGIEVDTNLAGMVQSGTLKAGQAFSTLLAGAVEDGSISIADAQQTIIEGLKGVDNQVHQNTAGVAIFGTQWEDLGPSALLSVDMTRTGMEDLAGATDTLNAKYNNFGSLFGGAWRMIQTEVLLPIGETLLNLANSAMPTISAAISGMGSAIQFVKDNAETMGPILAGVGVVIGGLLVAAFYAWAASAWAAAAGTIAAITPILPIILGVAAVVAVLGVAWNQNWGGIQEKTAAVWGFLSGTVWPWLQAAFDQITAILLPALSSAWGVVWPAIQSATATVYAFLKDTVWAWLSGTAWPWLKDYALPALSAAFSASWSAIYIAISTVYTWWKDTFYPWLSETFTSFKAWMEDLLFKWGFALAVLSGYIEAWSTVIAKVRDSVQGYINEIKGYFTTGWDTVQTTVQGVWDTISGYISGPIETAKGIVSRAIDAIKGYIQSAIDGINGMIDAINSIPGIPDMPEVPGGSSTQSTGGGSRSFSAAGAGGDLSSTAIFEAGAVTVVVPPGTPTAYRKQAEDGAYRGTQKALAEAGYRGDVRKRT